MLAITSRVPAESDKMDWSPAGVGLRGRTTWRRDGWTCDGPSGVTWWLIHRRRPPFTRPRRADVRLVCGLTTSDNERDETMIIAMMMMMMNDNGRDVDGATTSLTSNNSRRNHSVHRRNDRPPPGRSVVSPKASQQEAAVEISSPIKRP